MKNKIIILLLLISLACVSFMGCDNTEQPKSFENETEIDYGEIINWSLDKNIYSLDDSIVINQVSNYTGEINLYSFCGIPFALLQQKENYWIHVYPTYKECEKPDNIKYQPNITIALSDVDLGNGKEIKKGIHRLKIMYSTVGPDTYMKEQNIEIEIR